MRRPERGRMGAFERMRRAHLAHLGRCWRDSVKLAEKGIARRSSDPADEDARRSHVFDLALCFLQKHALSVEDFVELGISLEKRSRRRNRA